MPETAKQVLERQKARLARIGLPPAGLFSNMSNEWGA